MKLCRSHGIAILVDEVQTFARLETPFAFQYFGLEDLVDVLWIGKASQVCATFFRKEFAPGKGLMGQTYTSTASMVRSSLATLKHLNEGEYWGPKGKINRLARHTVNRLEAFAAETGLIEGPYGLGSMIAFTPFGGDGDKVSAFAQALFKNGVISLTAGANPTRVRFLLPYTVLDEAEIDKALEIVFSTLRSFAS
ncbi:MAG: 4-aminobutyrate aminotransferase PuuE [Verrucomicrobia bacterium ADurb.Bin474]|nr:MAG: 4-aminobutyrate aminotransferase PuuE [Verrucomicrobia bacterium ADurb.Bin474]